MVKKSKIHKVLIIKLGAIGDVALSLPLLSVYPDSEITWVVGKASEELIKAIPAISSSIIIDEKTLLEGSLLKKSFCIFKLWKKLFFNYFDVVITAHKDSRYRLLCMTTFKKNHFFFNKKTTSFPISHTFHSFEYLNLVTRNHTLSYPLINLPPIDHLFIENHDKPLILLNISGDLKKNKHLRLWPSHYFISLAELLSSYATIGLIGDKDAVELTKDFSHRNTLNFVGKTSLLELISLCKKALGIVTHDGGTLHLARLARCKICALFGPTSAQDFSIDTPEESSLSIGSHDLPCSPCYQGKIFPSCSHQSCLKLLTPEKVFIHIKHKWNLKKHENCHRS